MSVAEKRVKGAMTDLLRRFGVRTRYHLAFIVASVRLRDWLWARAVEAESRERLREKAR